MRTQKENRRDGWALKRLHQGAFTLIELMVVVAILLILMGITMRITTHIGDKYKRAEIVMNLEKIRNAVEAYYGANGYYPPGDTVNDGVFYKNGTQPNIWAVCFDDTIMAKYPSAKDVFSRAGMLYYLWTDSQKAKWASLLSGVANEEGPIPGLNITNAPTTSGGWTTTITNRIIVLACDKPERYRYECKRADNYQRFRVWNIGDDLKDGTADDIDASWAQ